MLPRAGCSGFPASRSSYFKGFRTVEIAETFYRLPRLATAQKWRLEAPAGFEYALRVPQLITHPSGSIAFDRVPRKIPERRRQFCGQFKPTAEVLAAWEETRAVAEAVDARFLVFTTPAAFYPDANHLADLYRFFKTAVRGGPKYVWHPQGAWEGKLIKKVCADLGLIHAVDPFKNAIAGGGAVNYFRMTDPTAQFAEGRLREILGLCAEKPSYVYFHRSAVGSAKRLLELAGARGGL